MGIRRFYQTLTRLYIGLMIRFSEPPEDGLPLGMHCVP